MLISWLATIFLFAAVILPVHCYSYGQRAKGFVYYPPYSDPFTDENDPCDQSYDWSVGHQESYVQPKIDGNGNCRGLVNGMTFIAPQPATVDGDNEPLEDYVVDLPSSDDETAEIGGFTDHLLSFTCRDRQGLVRSASLYFWIYQYRFRRIVKSHSYQTMMPWDTEGKMLFQPLEPRPANITCHYYDPTKGYFIRVRTWRLAFNRVQNPAASPISTTVEVIPCDSELVSLSSSPRKEIDVVVTSNRLELSAFCPVAVCSARPPYPTARTGYSMIKYEPMIPYYCKSNPADPASYSTCIIDPLHVDQISYQCSPQVPGSSAYNNQRKVMGTVKINIQSGARFANEADFKTFFFKEDDQNHILPCSVDPETSPGIEPIWQKFDSTTNQYKDIAPNGDFEMINNDLTGRHQLLIKHVKLEHEGSYRCVVAQSSKILRPRRQTDSASGPGPPIYGYHFVKVYPQPKCSLFDASTNQPIISPTSTESDEIGSNDAVIDIVKNRHITVKCLKPGANTPSNTSTANDTQPIFSNCQPGDPLCDTVTVILYKNGMLCSTSNSTIEEGELNSCGGSQRIAVKSLYPFEFDLTLRKGRVKLTTTTPIPEGSGALFSSGDGPTGAGEGELGGAGGGDGLIISDDVSSEQAQLDYDSAVQQHASIENDAGNYILQLMYQPPANLRIEIPLKIKAKAPPKPTTTTTSTTTEPTSTTEISKPPADEQSKVQLSTVLLQLAPDDFKNSSVAASNTTTSDKGDDRTVCVSFCLNWDCSAWWNWLLIVVASFILIVLIASFITCCLYRSKKRRDCYNVVVANRNIEFADSESRRRGSGHHHQKTATGGGPNAVDKNNNNAAGDFATISVFNHHTADSGASGFNRPLLGDDGDAGDNSMMASAEARDPGVDDDLAGTINSRQPMLLSLNKPTPAPPVMNYRNISKNGGHSRTLHQADYPNSSSGTDL